MKKRLRLFILLPFIGVQLSGCDSRTFAERLPAVGTIVPTFDLPNLAGGRVASGSLSGTPTVIALWETNCPASRLALQALATLAEDYKHLGLEVLVLAEDADPVHLRAFMDSVQITLPVAYASGQLRELFDGEKMLWQHSFPLPSFLIVDQSGRVAAVTMGVSATEVQSGNVVLQPVRDAIDRTLPQRKVESAPV